MASRAYKPTVAATGPTEFRPDPAHPIRSGPGTHAPTSHYARQRALLQGGLRHWRKCRKKTQDAQNWRICVRRRGATGTTLAAPTRRSARLTTARAGHAPGVSSSGS